MVMKPPVVIPLSGGVLGRASGHSRSRVNDDGDLQYVSWKINQVLGFPHRGEYIGGRAASGGGPGAGSATPWCGWPLAPLHLYFGLRLMSGKIGTSAFVSSNSENISCVAFLKHKNSKKQETGTVASH
jgi:hypothetical protein